MKFVVSFFTYCSNRWASLSNWLSTLPPTPWLLHHRYCCLKKRIYPYIWNLFCFTYRPNRFSSLSNWLSTLQPTPWLLHRRYGCLRKKEKNKILDNLFLFFTYCSNWCLSLSNWLSTLRPMPWLLLRRYCWLKKEYEINEICFCFSPTAQTDARHCRIDFQRFGHRIGCFIADIA